jgi:hypothetical protein
MFFFRVLLLSFFVQPVFSEAQINEQLKEQILDMVRLDKALRDSVYYASQTHGWSSKITLTYVESQKIIDKENRDNFEELVTKHGWPGKSLVGEEAAKGALVLLQHADSALQEKYLVKVIYAANRKEVPWSEVAYIQDGILMKKGKKQLYGTRYEVKFEKDRKYFVLWPIEDEKNVEARRKKIGLRPLKEAAKDYGIILK